MTFISLLAVVDALLVIAIVAVAVWGRIARAPFGSEAPEPAPSDLPSLIASVDGDARGVSARSIVRLGSAPLAFSAAAVVVAERLKGGSPQEKIAAAWALRRFCAERPELVPIFAGDAHPGVRRTAIESLAALAGRRPATVSSDVLDALDRCSRDEDASVRQATCAILGVLGGTSASASLGQALDDPAADVQLAAADALGNGELGSVETLVRTLARADPTLGRVIMRSLSRVQQPGAALAAIQRAGEAAATRLAAVRAAGAIASVDCVAWLAELLSNRDRAIRRQAARSMLGVAIAMYPRPLDTATVGRILAQLQRETAPQVRAALIDLLGCSGDKAAPEALMSALPEATPSVRERIMESLARFDQLAAAARPR